MQITRRADYALRAVLQVARYSPAERATTREIAGQQRIPLPFLAKIITRLVTVGIFETSRGVGGGVSLARPLNTISVLDVIEAIDGPIEVNLCVLDPSACPFPEDCPLHTVFCLTQAWLVDEWRRTTFDKLVHTRAPEPLPRAPQPISS
jgi:Rrf2 family protein